MIPAILRGSFGRQYWALNTNFGSASVSPINLSNPMVPTKGTDLTVGATPYSPGPNCIYFR